MFNAGDTVYVKTSLIDNQYYGGVFFNPLMSKYRGNKYKIEKVLSNKFFSDNGIVYVLSDKGGVLHNDKVTKAWYFSDDMLQIADIKCYYCKFMKKCT